MFCTMTKTSAIFLMAICFAAACAKAAPPKDAFCPVHKIEMRPTQLRILYGMPSPKEFEEMRAAKAKFPYGKDYVLGGCVVKPQKTVAGFVCPQCVIAREKWLVRK